jgi:phytoene/squalene synthetase
VALAAWKQRSLVAPPAPDDPVVLAWADARARYRIPTSYAEQLIDGVARDLTTARYA